VRLNVTVDVKIKTARSDFAHDVKACALGQPFVFIMANVIGGQSRNMRVT
jgi:hypothetical protein